MTLVLSSLAHNLPPQKKQDTASPYTGGPSSLPDPIPDNYRVVFSDLLGTHFLVVKTIIVLVGISMQTAKHAPRVTMDANDRNFLVAYLTPFLGPSDHTADCLFKRSHTLSTLTLHYMCPGSGLPSATRNRPHLQLCPGR